MAFVSGITVGAARQAPVGSRASLSGTPLSTSRAQTSTVRMGYGDYSYLTDETKGHVQQYYVDKFRIADDFVKGAPKALDDAKLGRNIKGGVYVPMEGIAQEMDEAIPKGEPMVDPRIAEADGSVYPWDVNYADPAFGKDTFADLEDEETVDNAFAAFRGSLSQERGEMLTAMDFGAQARVQRIKAGLDEKYLLSLDGALDVNYARLQKVADIPTLNPTGTPRTEIPGTPYLGSVGALDLQQKPKESVAFWKAEEKKELPYKRPGAADTPELPYNTSASVEVMKEAQKARGLLPGQE